MTGLLLLLAAALPAAAGDAPPAEADVRAAIERSLPWLQAEGVKWLDEKKCISCHHGPFMLRTLHEARLRGLAVDADKLAALDERTFQMFLVDRDKHEAKKGGQVESMNMLLGRAVRDDDRTLDDTTKDWLRAAGHLLANSQKDSGAWDYAGQPQKRPNEEAHEATTGWAILALASLEPLDESVAASRAKALAWLQAARRGEGNEALVVRILIERQFGDAAQVEALAGELVSRQNPDGGWSWSKERPSDPYATGQSLYALGASGSGGHVAAIRAGWKYLLDSQKADGSWLAPTKKAAGGNVISSFWGTAWATLGLINTLPSP